MEILHPVRRISRGEQTDFVISISENHWKHLEIKKITRNLIIEIIENQKIIRNQQKSSF
jgi:hypothetical protein